jgi:hypothetical protein
MMHAAFVLTILFVLAFLVWATANHRISCIGLPDGRVVYEDVERRRMLAWPLVSVRHGLTGKPDYLVETNDGLVPVELKSRECPRSGPYAGDAAQLTAYCVLAEDTTSAAPTHGIVQYLDRPWRIPYNRGSREQVLQILETHPGRPRYPICAPQSHATGPVSRLRFPINLRRTD